MNESNKHLSYDERIEELKRLRSSIENCFKCFPELKDYSHEEKLKIRKQNIREPWFFEGNDELQGFYGTGKVMFVGQRPSTGKSHNSDKKVLRFYNLLKKYGFENSHLTDLVKCRAPVSKLTEEEKTNCLPHFIEEIALVKPKLIIGIGDKAFKVLEKIERPMPVVLKISHYSQRIEKPDFVRK